ncbi:MAG TPA: hypothetical protein VFI73_05760 [Candidatus Nitrosopolaris sp.]|nr:hypothetical protein [Candidatus Nitrosopolaris sp.]
MKNLGSKWGALEKDGSSQHRCQKPVTAAAKHREQIDVKWPILLVEIISDIIWQKQVKMIS